ncbi:hypothetical protein SDC9_159914 [bioreactor metagenome]|uniref:Uncharacterized protein n=1 Tax=bioreactor metagenome TaxID=1076179 RepID=A0A645FG59_9ZZZZ
MCPSRRSASGSRSSVHRHRFPRKAKSFTAPATVPTFEDTPPSRASTYIPRRSFSRASPPVRDSWSLSGPAARYAFSRLPETNGACPWRKVPRAIPASMTPRIRSELFRIPSTSMSSASPRTRSMSSIASISAAPNAAPAPSSPGTAGTHDGAMT